MFKEIIKVYDWKKNKNIFSIFHLLDKFMLKLKVK